jgi:tryptophanyl-tRNA synthetase
MDLIEPTKKMSKSDERSGHSLPILSSSDDISTWIMGAATDSQKEIRFDPARPGIYNLLEIYEGVTGESRKEIESKFEGKGYGEFKKDLAEKVVEFLEPFKRRFKELTDDPSYIELLLKEGKDKAEALAVKKLTEVKSRIGLG